MTIIQGQNTHFVVSYRQLYKGQEVGRITWRLVPKS